MVEYKCERCNKIFKLKIDFTRHIERKNPCKIPTQTNPKQTQNQPCELECVHCKTKFTHKNSLYRHNKICKYNIGNEKERIYRKLMARVNKLEEKYKHITEENELIKQENEIIKRENNLLNEKIKQIKYRPKIINKNNKNSNNNTVNIETQNNNITIVNFGSEDISRLSDEEMIKVLVWGFSSITKLVEKIHFNPKFPDYHNVYIPSLKDKYGMVSIDGIWILRLCDEIIEELHDTKREIIEEKFNYFYDKLTNTTRDAINRLLELSEKDKNIKIIKDKIKLLLYNHKDMIINKLACCFNTPLQIN